MSERLYRWDLPKVSEARGSPRRKRIDYNSVKTIVDQVKVLMRREQDPEVKKDLVTAGMSLNRILLR